LYLRTRGYVCVLTFYIQKVRFSCKNTTYSDGKVWPGSGSGLVWLPESGSALKPMRIHNTDY
jgi:hypothetical protein